MLRKILFVDDDLNALATFKRNLRGQFQIETALGGEQGLEVMKSQGPFAVIVSDLRMPGMNGNQFLTRAREQAPDSVRVMLSGYADAQMAFDSVNAGTVFRFLLKPCPHETLVKALESGVAQYELITAERELLERTLKGAIEVLTEILSLVHPAAFSRAIRIRHYVKDIATSLQLPNLWQLEVAAMLSHTGCLTLPSELIAKTSTGEPLTDAEQAMYSQHPQIGGKLIANIPRLEPIAQMIENQQRPVSSYAVLPSSTQEREIMLGAQILKVAVDFDQLLINGLSLKAALEQLGSRSGLYNPEVVTALASGKGIVASFMQKDADHSRRTPGHGR